MHSDRQTENPLTKQVTSAGDAFIVTTGNRRWKSGLGDCFEDSLSCICGAFCPLCYSSHLYNLVDEDRCLPFVGGVIPLRIKVRLMLGIQGSLCGDCCLSLWCSSCVLCQIARELKAVGWKK